MFQSFNRFVKKRKKEEVISKSLSVFSVYTFFYYILISNLSKFVY